MIKKKIRRNASILQERLKLKMFFISNLRMKKSIFVGLLSMLLIVTIPVFAQVDDIRQERVQFSPGEIGSTINDNITGDDMVDYVLTAQAGQSMVVVLNTNNLSNYFNITAPGEDTAMFIGSTSGTRFQGELPKNGGYSIRVYLMRNAARRNETANYTLEIVIQ